MSDLQAHLKEHLKSAGDWEKMETPIEGVFVVKVPATKTRSALLFMEVNPLRDGKPMKRKGLFIGSREMLVKFSEALQEDKVYQLIGEIEKVNPESKSKTTKKLDF